MKSQFFYQFIPIKTASLSTSWKVPSEMMFKSLLDLFLCVCMDICFNSIKYFKRSIGSFSFVEINRVIRENTFATLASSVYSNRYCFLVRRDELTTEVVNEYIVVKQSSFVFDTSEGSQLVNEIHSTTSPY